MLTIEHAQLFGFQAAIRGMRNPKNSWDRMDSHPCLAADWDTDCPMVMNDDEPAKDCDPDKYHFCVGKNDLKLMQTLANSGPDDGKFLRMIHVQLDVIAPLYWWKEADQYKVGTVTNSCSTMHKIAAKEFTRDDFSTDRLLSDSLEVLDTVIDALNRNREVYLRLSANLKGDLDYAPKDFWWQMIQLLPSSYNQRRTWDLNYAVLRNIYHARRGHKLDEWHTLCDWIETLPYAKELIFG